MDHVSVLTPSHCRDMATKADESNFVIPGAPPHDGLEKLEFSWP